VTALPGGFESPGLRRIGGLRGASGCAETRASRAKTDGTAGPLWASGLQPGKSTLRSSAAGNVVLSPGGGGVNGT